jgi:hypothetical protein
LIGRKKHGAVRVGFSLEHVDDEIMWHIMESILIAKLAIIIRCYNRYYFTKKINGSSRIAGRGTKALSSGKLDYRVPVQTEDELGILHPLSIRCHPIMLCIWRNLKKANYSKQAC